MQNHTSLSVTQLKLLKRQTTKEQVKTEKEQLITSKHASAGPKNINAITHFTANNKCHAASHSSKYVQYTSQ